MASKQQYLGDGLYAEFDGYMLKLKANIPTTDVVYLEPSVWNALKQFMLAECGGHDITEPCDAGCVAE